MDIVLLGIQGCGKGTQAEIIARKYNLTIFETGQVLRNLAKENTQIGRKIKNILENGKLIPNKIVMNILKDFLNKEATKTSIIFDGIPRNAKQQELFDTLMQKKRRSFIVININLEEEEAVKRLIKRKRHDDTPEIIKKRIVTFQKNTKSVIEKYRKQKQLTDINGNQSIEKVAKDIQKVLNNYFLTSLNN